MLAIRIKQERIKKKLSQEELGKKFRVTQQAVNKWETSKSEPDNDMLKRLAVFFECSVDYLLGITNERRTINTIKEDAATYFTVADNPFVNELIKKLPNLSEVEKQELWDQLQFTISKIEKNRSRKINEDKELLKAIEDVDLSQIKIAAHDEDGQPLDSPDELKEIIKEIIIKGRKDTSGTKD